MTLATRSSIAFRSPLAQTLAGQTPVSVSDVVAGVGLADLSGQTLTHVRAVNLDSVYPDAPQNVGDVAVKDGKVLARLRGDGVLIIGEAGIENAVSEKNPVVTVTDITEGRGHLLLIGQYAKDVLAKTCGLDFDDSQFPDKHVAQTSVAKVRTTIIRNDRDGVPAYHLILGYSSTEYFWSVLFDATAEFEGKYFTVK